MFQVKHSFYNPTLLWLCLALVICPFKVIIKLSKRGKLVRVTVSLRKQRVGDGHNKIDTCCDCNLRNWVSSHWTKGVGVLIHFITIFTALFKNTWTLKFKSQLTFAFFAAVNHLRGPLRKHNCTQTGSKSSFFICDWWISIRFVCFCVSRFVACDRSYDWRQRKTQLWRQLLNFAVRVFVKSAVILKEKSLQLSNSGAVLVPKFGAKLTLA